MAAPSAGAQLFRRSHGRRGSLSDGGQEERKNSRRTKRGSWQADDSSRQCMWCGATFTLLTRRHHCRLCGLLFCGKCTALRIPREELGPGFEDGPELVRSCRVCWLRQFRTFQVEHEKMLRDIREVAQAPETIYTRTSQAHSTGDQILWCTVALRRFRLDPSLQRKGGCLVIVYREERDSDRDQQALTDVVLSSDDDDNDNDDEDGAGNGDATTSAAATAATAAANVKRGRPTVQSEVLPAWARVEAGRTEVQDQMGMVRFGVSLGLVLDPQRTQSRFVAAVYQGESDNFSAGQDEDLVGICVLAFDWRLGERHAGTMHTWELGFADLSENDEGGGRMAAKLRRRFAVMDAPAGTLVLHVDSVERHQHSGHARGVERRFGVGTPDGQLYLRETLIPSKVAFSVPMQLLPVLAERTLCALGQMVGRGMAMVDADRNAPIPDTLSRMVARMHAHISDMFKAMPVCLPDSPESLLHFKPSTQKTDARYAGIATNLHVQTLSWSLENVCEWNAFRTITVGAFAHHSLGLKPGHGARSLAVAVHEGRVVEDLDDDLADRQEDKEKAKAKKKKKKKKKGKDTSQHPCPFFVPGRDDTPDDPLVHHLTLTELELERRRVFAGSQALGALVIGFLGRLEDILADPDPYQRQLAMEQLHRVGFLCSFESLLSTHKKEAVMLEDMADAVQRLEQVVFRIAECEPRAQIACTPEPNLDDEFDLDLDAAVATLASLTLPSDSNPRRIRSSSEIIDDAIVVQDNDLEDAQPQPSTGILETSACQHTTPDWMVTVSVAGTSDNEDDRGDRSNSGGCNVCEGIRACLSTNTQIVVSVKAPPSVLEGLGVYQLGEGREDDSWAPWSGSLEIRTCPLLFTQGINEMQTMANLVGSSKLQEEINSESLLRLQKLYSLWVQLHAHSPEHLLPDMALLSAMLTQLTEEVHGSRAEKNTSILTRAADLCRLMGAARFTSCKSAKDRTAMSVTFEQSRLIEHHLQQYNVPGDQIADMMRSHGVRRENAFYNVGQRRYAFNRFQRKLLPDAYKPPDGTGKRVKS